MRAGFEDIKLGPEKQKECAGPVASGCVSWGRMKQLTNAFFKDRENLKAAYALRFAYCAFWVYHTLKVRPAMEAGTSDVVWEIYGLLQGLEK
jgi:hypothetical protein